MAVYTVAGRKLSGHYRSTARGTDTRANVELRKTCALGCESIEVRRFEAIVAVAAQIAPTPIVREDEDDVWSVRHKNLSPACSEVRCGLFPDGSQFVDDER